MFIEGVTEGDLQASGMNEREGVKMLAFISSQLVDLVSYIYLYLDT